MNFRKREVTSIHVSQNKELIFQAVAEKNKVRVTVWAHKEDETDSQALGIEQVNLHTGEVMTQRINLPVNEFYVISVKELLVIDQSKLDGSEFS